MSLKHTILGFLSISPKTGYDLQKKIELTIQHFWPSTQSQIYRTLKELESESLIKSELHVQSEKPNKKIYTLTDEGKDELIKWLSEPLKIAPHRNQFLVQLFFSNNVDSTVIIANLSNYRKELGQRLAFLKSADVKSRLSLGETPKERLLFEVILENGIRILESEIGWVDDAVSRFQALEKNIEKE